MKALTLKQPWASAIGFKFKQWETRSWKPADTQLKPGQWLAIHAARSTAAAEVDAGLALEGMALTLGRMGITRWTRTGANLPMGAVIAVCKYQGVFRTNDVWGTLTPLERSMGNYEPGRWAWQLSDIMRLHRVIQCAGHQGIWTLEYKTRLQVAGQLIADGTINVVPGATNVAGLIGEPEG